MNILVLENDYFSYLYVESICSIFEDVNLFYAKKIEEATLIYFKEDIDLIITDIILKKDNGLYFASFVRAISEVPIIIVTSLPVEYVEKQIDINQFTFLTKPLEEKSIFRLVKKKSNINKNHYILNNHVFELLNKLYTERREVFFHSIRMLYYTNKFTKKLHLSNQERIILQKIVLMHDIGKLLVPDDILYKESCLSKQERSIIESHAKLSVNIIRKYPSLFYIANYVLSHHERWDGTGYPHNLREKTIPFLSRVVSIVDAYDAITSQRCYKSEEAKEIAIMKIETNLGKQFDPILGKEFIKMLQENYVGYDEMIYFKKFNQYNKDISCKNTVLIKY